jgi:hypothetical protein
MFSNGGTDRETIFAAVGQWEQAQAELTAMSFDALAPAEALAVKAGWRRGFAARRPSTIG